MMRSASSPDDRWMPAAALLPDGPATMDGPAGRRSVGRLDDAPAGRGPRPHRSARAGRSTGRAARPGPAPRQGRGDRPQLPGPRDEEGSEPPAAPLVFAKWPTSVIGPGDEIRWDPALDRARSTTRPSWASSSAGPRGGSSEADALDYVLGYTCLERRVGARPPVRRRPVGPRQVARHVLPDGPGARHGRRDRRPAGPRDRLPRRRPDAPGGQHRRDVLRGRRRSSATARSRSRSSRATSSRPGTPGGVGVFRDPPVLLGDGDEVVVEIERIGRLVNVCRFDRAAAAGVVSGAANGSSSPARSAASAPGRSRALVREGVPVTTFDLGGDPRRLRQIMTPDELASGRLRRRRHHRPRRPERGDRRPRHHNVIHLAALQVPFCRADPPLGALVNVVGTVNVFEAVKRRSRTAAWRRSSYTSSIGMFAATTPTR